MEITRYGMRLNRALPITLDSIKANRYDGPYEELTPGSFYIKKPQHAYGPFWLRLYHAWLVLTNRAMAVQFSADHLHMANQLAEKEDFALRDR